MLRDLEEWRRREHKSLLIDGPRGVGKTTLVREFARSEGSELLEVDISRNAEARFQRMSWRGLRKHMELKRRCFWR